MMARHEGLMNKVYSPYSVFVALMMAALLSSGEVQTELLGTLNIDGCNFSDKKIAAELARFVRDTEYPEVFYNPAFDSTIKKVEQFHEFNYTSLTVSQKLWLYLKAVKKLGSVDRVLNPSADDLITIASLFGPVADRPFVITGANDIWPSKNIDLADFSILVDALNATIRPVDFPEPGRTQINEYIEQKTHGLIKDLLSSSDLSEDTELILTNALYFKGQWDKEFNVISRNWTLFDGSSKTVDTLRHLSQHRTLSTPDADLISIKYAGSDYSMVIALPKAPGEESFKQMANVLTESHLIEVTHTPKSYTDLSFPKFTIEWGAKSLKDTLEALGTKGLFSTGLVGGRYPVSDVVQKAKISVDEFGTEAAAATAVIATRSAMIHDPVRFVCDRPFMYYIFNKANGAILFMGSVVDP